MLVLLTMLDLVRMDEQRLFAVDLVDLFVIRLQGHFENVVWVQTKRAEDAIDLELLQQSRAFECECSLVVCWVAVRCSLL